MTDSVFTGSVVVVDEVPTGGVGLAGLPEQPAVPDAGCEGENSLADARPDAIGDVPAVQFERQLALGGLVDRFDPLSDATELPEPRLLVLAVGADEGRIERGDDLLKLLAGEAFVADDDLAATEQARLACSIEHRRGDLAFGLVRGCQTEVDG